MSQTIQLRRDKLSNRESVNPILAEGEIGIETDTKQFKIGNGINSWNTLTYGLNTITETEVLKLEGQIVIPTAPAPGYMNFFAKTISGRMLPEIQGDNGLSTTLQPSFFQNMIYIINTGNTTVITSIGDIVLSSGTISHPVVTELYGRMANFASAAIALSTCGTGTANVNFCRGSMANGSNGFFVAQRLAFPDSSYDATIIGTGTRMFVGVTDQTLAASVSIDNPLGNRFGFSRLNVFGGVVNSNFFITSRDGTTENRFDTGMLFLPQKVYDFWIFCPVLGNIIYWRIDNVTDLTTQEGSVTTNLPTNTVFMRAGFQVQTVNAISRNVRMQRVYVETDQ